MFLMKNLGREGRFSAKQIHRQIYKTTGLTNADCMSLHLDESRSTMVREEKRMVEMLSLQKFQRFLSTSNSNHTPHEAREAAVMKDVRRDFTAVLPDLIRDVSETAKHLDVETWKWMEKVLQYNVPGGKLIRGHASVVSYKLLEKPENLTPENLRLANIMGWCIEILQTFFYLLDDVLDGSTMRRGVQCWHTLPEVGVSAVNDYQLVLASMYVLLKKNFGNKPYYKNVLDMFNEMLLKTAIGQHMDMVLAKGDKPDLWKFTMDRYNAMAKYKTAYYTVHLPVAVAMFMCGIGDPETHRQVKTISSHLGIFLQIKNDFLDCYGKSAVTGKADSDIQEGKCSWLAVLALQRGNPAQKHIMEEYYGSKNPEHVAKIIGLYEELAIPHEYAVYEKTSYNLMKTLTQKMNSTIPHDLFLIIEKIYVRKL